ncbi:MAG: signal peptidase II [Clostridia bacterium]|nr:signal peptidase II [Clostridia bacterium]
MLITTVVLLVVLCDVLSKYLVVQLLLPLERSVTVIPGILDFTYVENRGAAFGMLSNSRWIFMTVSVVFIFVLIYVLKQKYSSNTLYTVSLCLFLGGGIGNMIDRVFLGYVVDFVEFTFVDFAVFNVADSAISIGAVLFVVYLIFFDTVFFPRKQGKDKDNA